MERSGLIHSWKDGKKTLCDTTSDGKDACVYFRIRREAGYSGIQWAVTMLEKGYEVRFLYDLTGLENHKRWLFAWNPSTGDSDLAFILGTRSAKSKPGGPAYIAQYVDRNQNPDAPIRHNELLDYIKQNVKDFNNESRIGDALKTFWDSKITQQSSLCPIARRHNLWFSARNRSLQLNCFCRFWLPRIFPIHSQDKPHRGHPKPGRKFQGEN